MAHSIRICSGHHKNDVRTSNLVFIGETLDDFVHCQPFNYSLLLVINEIDAVSGDIDCDLPGLPC